MTLICRVPASPVKAQVRDVSYYGCKLGIPSSNLLPGGSITLELANGERVAGVIAWSQAAAVGVRFHRRLHSRAAVFLGIEEPPPPEPEYQPYPEAPTGLLTHWYRRLATAFTAIRN